MLLFFCTFNTAFSIKLNKTLAITAADTTKFFALRHQNSTKSFIDAWDPSLHFEIEPFYKDQ